MRAFLSGRRWLLLVVFVLLAHLALMAFVSDSLAPLDPAASAEAAFATRTFSEAPSLAPLIPSEVERTHAQPRPRPAPAKPVPQDRPAETLADSQSAAPEPAEAATPPEQPASAPEVAQAPEAAQEPPAKTLRFNPDSLSPSTKLIYTLKTSKFPFSLNAELLWRNLGDSYNARLRYSAFGQTRMQTSQGKITDAGLAPERFGDKYRSEVAAHFNTAQGKISFSANTPDMPLLPGAQDRLSVLIQLGALVASDPAHFGPGTSISIQTAGPRSADVWLFTVMHSEPLDLPGGAVQSVKLERQPREPYDQKVEVWLSPQLAYLPVRIRITEANGDSADQQWRASEPATDAD